MSAMSFFPAFSIQVGLFFLPIFLMLVAEVWVPGRVWELLVALLIALAAGGVAYHVASAWGWKPLLKGGHVANLSPVEQFWAFFGGHSAFRLLFAIAQGGKQIQQSGSAGPVEQSGEPEGDWRVGHRGRDGMYYEEYRDGQWERLEISGEMLMGPAHYVIYFASTEQWLAYPEWARGRRDEIIAKIKSRFAPPDYEYHGG